MKFVSVLMTVAFAGVVAHANETAPAHAAPAAAPAAATTTEVKTEKKTVKKTHAKKEDKAAAPAGH